LDLFTLSDSFKDLNTYIANILKN